MNNAIIQLQSYAFNPHGLLYFISGVAIIAEAFFVFHQNKKSMLHISFSLCTFIAGIWQTGVGMIYLSATEDVAFFWARYHSWLGIIFVTPAVYLFSVYWVGGSTRKKLLFTFVNCGIALGFYILCIKTNYMVNGMWHYSWGFYPRAGRAESIFILWFYGLMILAFRNFILSYRSEPISIKKTQTKMIFIAFVFGFMGSLDFIPNFGVSLYTFASISVFLFTTAIAYSIVTHKLMEIETVIHKTIGWFFTSLAVVAPLAALLYFTRDWYVQLSPVGTTVYLGVTLLCFVSFVKVFYPKIDHFFQKGRFDLEAVLNNFVDELVRLRTLDALVSKITDTIVDTLYADGANIFLYNDRLRMLIPSDAEIATIESSPQLDPESLFLRWLAQNNGIVNREFLDIDPRYDPIREEAAQYFKTFKTSLCVPLILDKKLIGLINVDRKVNLEPFKAADIHFLTLLKNQVTIAVSNSLIYDRVEELVKLRTDELLHAQQQLVQSEKLATVGTLAGGVAHEINNPLTAILTNVQMLLQSINAPDDHESLELIEEATKRCRTIVQKLMTYSRKPLAERQPTSLDIVKILNTVINFLRYQLEQENVTITLQQKQDSFVVEGCKSELEQVFTNLILNAKDAIKTVKKSGDITISLTKHKQNIIINIADEGCGIHQQELTKIFDPFFTTKDVGKGTGLGLSICQSIIAEHHGDIKVSSAPGKGSTFTIVLPDSKAFTSEGPSILQ